MKLHPYIVAAGALLFSLSSLQAETPPTPSAIELAGEWSEAFTVIKNEANSVTITVVREEQTIVFPEVTSLRDDGSLLMTEMRKGGKTLDAAVFAKDVVAIAESSPATTE